jgi:hypothetical protein
MKQLLTAPDALNSDYFGGAVAIYQQYKLLVGAWGSDSFAGGGGCVYSYRTVNGAWSSTSRLYSSVPTAGQWFGSSIALSHHWAVIGAPGDMRGGYQAGSAHVYTDDGYILWQPRADFIGEEGDSFGKTVSIYDSVIAIAAPTAHRSTTYDAFSKRTGRVTIYRLVNNYWTFDEYIICNDCTENSYFGLSISLLSDVITVGKIGGAYTFQYKEDEPFTYRWATVVSLIPSDGLSAESHGYGFAVAQSRYTVFVGSKGESSNNLDDTGAVFVFRGLILREQSDIEAYQTTLMEIKIYDFLYSAIATGLTVLSILVVVFLTHVLYDNIRAVESAKPPKEENPFLFKL